MSRFKKKTRHIVNEPPEPVEEVTPLNDDMPPEPQAVPTPAEVQAEVSAPPKEMTILEHLQAAAAQLEKVVLVHHVKPDVQASFLILTNDAIPLVRRALEEVGCLER